MALVKRLLKIMAALAGFAVLGIVLLLGLLWLDHNRDTMLPTLTGPFAVGRITYDWSDAAHPGAKRDLFVWIWYPAAPRQPSQTADDYLPASRRAAVEQQWGITRFLARDLSRVRTQSVRDAEVSSDQRSYPVVLMAGGFMFTSLAEDLASHGYVVVSFDARSLAAPQDDLDMVSGAELERLATKAVEAGSADLRFALDQLERLNTGDASGKFLGRLDVQRVGAFGHSIRGATALQFCHDDPRCKACIDVDGGPWGSVVRDGVIQPVLFLMSDHRGDSDDDEGRQIRANFGLLFERLPGDRWREIMIRGANHYMFSDDAVLRSPVVMPVLRAVGIVGIDGRRQVAVAGHFISRFFDVYLKGDGDSGLRGDAGYPEVEYVH